MKLLRESSLCSTRPADLSREPGPMSRIPASHADLSTIHPGRCGWGGGGSGRVGGGADRCRPRGRTARTAIPGRARQPGGTLPIQLGRQPDIAARRAAAAAAAAGGACQCWRRWRHAVETLWAVGRSDE